MGRPKGSKNKEMQNPEISTAPGSRTIIEAEESVIRPEIKVQGEEHIFETLEKLNELPVLTSVGMVKVSETARDYVSYTIKSRGREILSVEVSEPDSRMIAEDSAKIAFVSSFMNVDGVL